MGWLETVPRAPALITPLSVSAPLVSWKVTVVSGVMPVSPAMRDNTAKGALWAITATLEQQVAAARSVTATPKALSTVTVTVHPGSVFASQELQDSAVRNAFRDTS